MSSSESAFVSEFPSKDRLLRPGCRTRDGPSWMAPRDGLHREGVIRHAATRDAVHNPCKLM